MFTKLVFLLSGLPRVEVLERFYQNGLQKDILNGICGLVTLEGSRITQIVIIAQKKPLRFMDMSMQCIFLFILGQLVEIKNCPQIIKKF